MQMIFLLCLFSNPIAPGLQPYSAVASPSGILLNTDQGIYHYSLDGELLAKIVGSPSDYVLPLGKDYLLRDLTTFKLRLYNQDGSIKQVIDNVSWRIFEKISDNRLAVVPGITLAGNVKKLNKKKKLNLEHGPFLKAYDPGSNPNPNMIDILRIREKNGIYHFTLEKSFFRVTSAQKSFNLNFKKMFVQLHDEIYFVMTELDDKIYYYSDETIQKERLADPHATFDKPALELNLEDFIPSHKNPYKLKPIYYDQRDWTKDFQIFVANFSRIFYFSKTEFGFLIVYSVPQKNNDDQSNKFKLYIQEVDMIGSNRGPAKIFEDMSGSFAGIVDKDLYWLSQGLGEKASSVKVMNLD